RFFYGDSWSKAADGIATPERLRRITSASSVEHGLKLEGQIELGFRPGPHATKVLRGNSRDRGDGIRYLNPPADDSRVAAEVVFPEIVTEDNRPTLGRAAANIVGRCQQPAQVGVHSQYFETVAGNEARRDQRWSA